MVHVIVLHLLQQNQTLVEEHQPLISRIGFVCGESTSNNSNPKKDCSIDVFNLFLLIFILFHLNKSAIHAVLPSSFNRFVAQLTYRIGVMQSNIP